MFGWIADPLFRQGVSNRRLRTHEVIVSLSWAIASGSLSEARFIFGCVRRMRQASLHQHMCQMARVQLVKRIKMATPGKDAQRDE